MIKTDCEFIMAVFLHLVIKDLQNGCFSSKTQKLVLWADGKTESNLMFYHPFVLLLS